MRTKRLVKPALCAALICLLSPFVIAIGPIPLSLATFALYLTAGLLPPLQAVGAVGVYLLLGAVGLPVFGGFIGGIQQFVGPTGGFLIGYVVLVTVAAHFTHLNRNAACGRLHLIRRRTATPSPQGEGSSLSMLVGFVLGTVGCYACGVVWYALYADISFFAALSVCTVPFLLGDLIKILAAWNILFLLKKQIHIR